MSMPPPPKPWTAAKETGETARAGRRRRTGARQRTSRARDRRSTGSVIERIDERLNDAFDRLIERVETSFALDDVSLPARSWIDALERSRRVTTGGRGVWFSREQRRGAVII